MMMMMMMGVVVIMMKVVIMMMMATDNIKGNGYDDKSTITSPWPWEKQQVLGH